MSRTQEAGVASDRTGVARSTPSPIATLERAVSLASEAMYAIDLQIRRLNTVEPEDEVFLFRCFTDLQFLIIVLHRLDQIAGLALAGATQPAALKVARQRFREQLPDLITMRNVEAHLDDYALDVGRDSSVGRRQLQVASWGDGVFEWLNRPDGTRRSLDVAAARMTAGDLYQAIRRERDQWGTKRDPH